MSEELKPCPFCGSKAVYSIEESDAPFPTTCHYVTCSNENCLEGLYSSGYTKEEAIKAWNTRANPWHTGRPTEDGEYVCTIKINTTDRDGRPFECMVNRLLVFEDGYATNNIIGEPHEIIRYLKVEPYEESKE